MRRRRGLAASARAVHQHTRADRARVSAAPVPASAAPPGWAYRARRAITQAASRPAKWWLTRAVGTISATPPRMTEAMAEPFSASHVAVAS
jgi:hypothetical protein